MPFRLNQSREHFKWVALMIALCSICTFLIKLVLSSLEVETYAALFPLFGAIACYLYSLSDTYMGFDNTIFYVQKEKIPLQSVDAIRLTQVNGNKNIPYWEVVYTSSTHQLKKSVRILPDPSSDLIYFSNLLKR